MLTCPPHITKLCFNSDASLLFAARATHTAPVDPSPVSMLGGDGGGDAEATGSVMQGGILAWDVAYGSEKALVPSPHGLTELSLSPDGDYLVSGDAVGGISLRLTGALNTWDKDKPRFELKGHTGGITCFSWNHQSSVLASGARDRRAHHP